MYIIRLISAVSLIFLFYQLAQDPENLGDLASFSKDGMNDLFDWGNDRFVLGKLPDASGNSNVKKKSARQLFEEAILGEPEEEEYVKFKKEDDEKKDEDEDTKDDSDNEDKEEKEEDLK